MSVLKIKDQNGQWTDVLSIKGEKGDNGQDYVLTENDKQEIAQDVVELVDIPVDDVQINGTSIVTDGIANIPVARVGGNTIDHMGVVGIGNTNGYYGIRLIGDGILSIEKAPESKIKKGSTESYQPIVPNNQHIATFYGLAKAAGDTTQSASDNAVGTYTDDAKASIQSMLGVPSENGVVTDVQIDSTSIIADGVAEIPIASTSNFGVTKIKSGYGIRVSSSNEIIIDYASEAGIKNGVQYYTPIVPRYQHNSVFYGLAKASGDTTQSQSSNAVGTYTDEAKASIQSMLGVPSEDEVITDVQINGTSVVTDGVANISLGNNSQYGVVKGNTAYGINITNGEVRISSADSNLIKVGSTVSKPLTPNSQHESTFYGLAKIAGHDEKDSTLPAGTYTEDAKSAISSMLNAPESVSGITPSITTKAGVRYICGECTTLDITTPESGIVDITFTSGATPTVLTVTPPTGMTMMWANGFDPTTLEANTVYEINIMDGCKGVACSWT